MGGSNSTGGTGGGGTSGGPLECLTCIAQDCPFLVDCAQDPTCYDRLLCTIQECLADDLALECLIECHDGDVVAAFELAQALTCPATTCADRCNFGL